MIHYCNFTNHDETDFEVEKIGGFSNHQISVTPRPYSPSGFALQVVVTSGFWATGILRWITGPEFVFGDVVALFRYITSDLSTGTKVYGPAARVSDEGSGVDAIHGGVNWIADDDVLGHTLNGSMSVIAFGSSDPSGITPAASAVNYWMRLNLAGDLAEREYRMRSWPEGEPEPSEWAIEATGITGSETVAAGRPGILLNRLEPESEDSDTIGLSVLSVSTDPDVPAPLFLGSYFNRGRRPEGRRRSLEGVA